MNGLDSLYQELILDHSKHPHGQGLAPEEGRTASSHQHNPMCGDDITLRVRVDDAGQRLVDLSWEG
ncbi:MAG TPA: iron-sulfur cluster assembly scaffold protein, partial [Microbacterium sp.]|nr:iron-sulfur cluster assembly scaffold protein [Microbacterium sp.]